MPILTAELQPKLTAEQQADARQQVVQASKQLVLNLREPTNKPVNSWELETVGELLQRECGELGVPKEYAGKLQLVFNSEPLEHSRTMRDESVISVSLQSRHAESG